VAHLIRRSTALQIHRADLCFAASSTRPHRLCSPAVVCRGDFVAADAPGAVAVCLAVVVLGRLRPATPGLALPC
jgi:hypothetical protein